MSLSNTNEIALLGTKRPLFNHRSIFLLVGLPVSFFIMAVRFNERKHGGFPWRFNGISFLFKSRITGSKQSSILLYTHCGSHFLVRTVFIDFLES